MLFTFPVLFNLELFITPSISENYSADVLDKPSLNTWSEMFCVSGPYHTNEVDESYDRLGYSPAWLHIAVT